MVDREEKIFCIFAGAPNLHSWRIGVVGPRKGWYLYHSKKKKNATTSSLSHSKYIVG